MTRISTRTLPSSEDVDSFTPKKETGAPSISSSLGITEDDL